MVTAHQLVKAILTACASGHDQASLHVATEAIRRELLVLGSETPDNVACATQIEFGPSTERKHGRDTTFGLRLTGSNILVSEVLWAAEDASIPETVREAFPTLTEDAWSAVMRLVTLIAISLECDG